MRLWRMLAAAVATHPMRAFANAKGDCRDRALREDRALIIYRTVLRLNKILARPSGNKKNFWPPSGNKKITFGGNRQGKLILRYIYHTLITNLVIFLLINQLFWAGAVRKTSIFATTRIDK
jgi:hypothetical protein